MMLWNIDHNLLNLFYLLTIVHNASGHAESEHLFITFRIKIFMLSSVDVTNAVMNFEYGISFMLIHAEICGSMQ